jgi:hypothetical protein
MTEAHFYHGSLGAPLVDDADLVVMFGSKGYSDDFAPYQYAAIYPEMIELRLKTHS